MPAHKIADNLGIPVWLVDSNGGIDPLASPRLVTRRSSAHTALREVMERFNRVRSGDEGIEAGLDLVASFPIKTSEGMLDRKELREAIRSRPDLTEGVFPQRNVLRFWILIAHSALRHGPLRIPPGGLTGGPGWSVANRDG